MSYSYFLKKAYWLIIIVVLSLNLFSLSLPYGGSWRKFFFEFTTIGFVEAFVVTAIATLCFLFLIKNAKFKFELSSDLKEPFFSSRIMKAIVWILIFLNMPAIVMIEEEIFRAGTGNFAEVIVKSMGFGFAHMILGAPFAAACVLSGVGVWLSLHYMEAGVTSSFWFHTAYNIWVALFYVAYLLKKRLVN